MDDAGGTRRGQPEGRSDPGDLPYTVEVWDETGAFVDHVAAVSVSPSIGYAAFYAATREYPGRAITLRHHARVLSRWAARPH